MTRSSAKQMRENIPPTEHEKFIVFAQDFKFLSKKLEILANDIANDDYNPSHAHMLTIQATTLAILFDRQLREP